MPPDKVYKKEDIQRLPKLPDQIEESEDSLLEKQGVLLELERLRQRGVRLTKDYTLKDNITDMQFEMRRHLLHIDEINSINFMKDAMRLALTGIELTNNRVGPFLDLDGWSATVSSDINKYDNALSKLYKKYWKRKTSTSPELEIAFGIIGSMGMYHFRKKLNSVPIGIMPATNRFNENRNTYQRRNHTNASSDDSDDESLPP
jgi:hypothetical protein